jgi:hypothetical protein
MPKIERIMTPSKLHGKRRHSETVPADGKLEGLQQQLRQLENQVGEILELVKCKEEREKTRQVPRGSQVKKRGAPPSEGRRSLRLKKLRQS